MLRPGYSSSRPLPRRLSRLVLLGLVAGAHAGPTPAGAPDPLAGSYEYLVSYRATHNGALYKPADGPFKDLSLPYSFGDSERYWGDYVCRQPSTSCAVADYYDPADYAIKARPGAGAILQSERINVHNGTNIYDAATWQIAVMLGSVVNHYPNLIDADPYELASHQDEVLGRLHNVRDVPTGSRATTAGALYRYNGTSIADPRQAYAFRMTAPQWLVPDPLQGPRYASVISVSALPANNPRYKPGLVSWSDWKPITGDNAWAFLVGPLQAAYLQYQVRLHGQYVPFASVPVQNALAVLPAFAAMQSACGAVYYAPSGTLENAADVAVDRADVSIENNLSLFAGLGILRGTLAAELAREPSLSAEDRRRLTQGVALIDTMLAGGGLPGERNTRGLRDFLHRHAWRDGEFVQAGFANEPGRAEEWRPVTEPRAVDVNTWGVAALGAKQIDDWFGAGAAYRLWESVKRWGAYGEGQTLYGVGYSDADGNGRLDDGRYRSGVLSAEWTAGAIVAVRNMAEYYGATPKGVDAPRARILVVALKADEEAMVEGLERMRFSRYVDGHLTGKPAHYPDLIVEPTSPIPSEPYLYSSRRYRIPFGWYGNPLPSTSSTAWAILIADHFDPFGYRGRPN
ncbi:MAG: hypothetical protein JSS29_00090 [Proteobacteria bacterium]|nr:hypothetical protein [Pseudomonadota bacterium]